MIIEKDFTFDSAHFLPNTPPDHKCRRIHGHTYLVTFGIEGETTPHEQWVLDFGEIKKIVSPLIDTLDHTLLNAIPGLENPTAEVIAKYIYHKVKVKLPNLIYCIVQETPSSRAIYKEKT